MLPFKMLQRSNYEKWRAQWFWGKEPETIAWIESMRPGEWLWDIGANIGVYSLFAGSRGVNVIAFEPGRINFETLVKNIGMNGFKIEAHNIGLGSRRRVARFKNQEAGESCIEGNKGEEILIARGDDLIFLPRPKYIKIDVDGCEDDVLIGLKGVMNGVESVMVEVNNYLMIYEIMRHYHFTETLTLGRINKLFRRLP